MGAPPDLLPRLRCAITVAEVGFPTRRRFLRRCALETDKNQRKSATEPAPVAIVRVTRISSGFTEANANAQNTPEKKVRKVAQTPQRPIIRRKKERCFAKSSGLSVAVGHVSTAKP